MRHGAGTNNHPLFLPLPDPLGPLPTHINTLLQLLQSIMSNAFQIVEKMPVTMAFISDILKKKKKTTV